MGLRALAPVSLLLLFWWVSLAGLVRYPVLHNDEVSILAAGYKLFQQGVYGVDMYAGWHGREAIYLEIMPLMSWLQGLGSWIWGVGVWQMRMLPVMVGLLTLALVFALGRRLADWLVGFAAMVLLLVWQWSPGSAAFFGSGIPLLDLVRIGRYDILTAPLSLGIMLTWLLAYRKNRPLYYLLCGLLVGLVGLTQLYGLFWLAVIVIWWVGEKIWWRTAVLGRNIALIFLAAFGVMSIWLLMVLANFQLFQAQFGVHDSRFDLFSLSFYVNNFIAEGQRYFLGINQPGTWGRMGFWLVIIGLPSVMIWLGWRIIQKQDRLAFGLLVPCLLLPFMFALLVQKKQFAYLLLVMPLWVVALAWAWRQLWHSARPWSHVVGAILAILIIWEGGSAWREFHHTAVRAPSPLPFFAALQEKTPDGRILGPQTYWLAFSDREYRSITVPALLVQPHIGQPAPLASVLMTIDPDVVLVNPTLLQWLADSGQAENFWNYMAAHQAQMVAELQAYDGSDVQIYQLR